MQILWFGQRRYIIDHSYLLFAELKVMRKPFVFVLLCIAMLFPAPRQINSQIRSGDLDGSSGMRTNLVSALFLTIAPDARSAGMGDVGAATDPDLNSQHWNVAKYAMIEGKGGVSASYTPWLRNLIPSINLGYLSGYYRINDKNVLSTSFRYLSLGEVAFIQPIGTPVYVYRFELAGDIAYSRKFTDHFSGGLALRYIHSDLGNGVNFPDGINIKPGRSVAGDLSLYYKNQFEMGSKDAFWALGLNLSNMGTPISYQEDAEIETPIPTNLRLGGKFKLKLDENNSISLFTDLNKLLVPTAPVYEQNPLTGDYIIARGMEPRESVLAQMVQSFYDAPGVWISDGDYSVVKEEMHEIQYCAGLEYYYKSTFALRSGLFHEHSTKGNRRYVTLGAGARYKFLSLDLAYLIPFNGQNSPLANTFRITLAANFASVQES